MKHLEKLALFFWVRLTEQIPVERGNSLKAIKKSVKYLKRGKLVGVFPESTTIGAPKLRRFHTGVARIALEARAPIIPIALINTFGIFSFKHKFIKSIQPVEIRVGKPLNFEEYFGKQNDRKITRKVSSKVREEVRKLLK